MNYHSKAYDFRTFGAIFIFSYAGGRMKGIVFNLLQEVVVQYHGEDVWDALLDAAGVDGVYTSLGNYADADMAALVTAASQALGIPPAGVQRWFGQSAMPLLAQRYPAFFAGHASARSFVLSVNNIIHPEVRKVYPGADVPTFEFRDAEDGALMMGYRSARKMCALAQGFVEGAATHFGEAAQMEHLRCMLQGHDSCQIRIVFSSQATH